MPHVVDTKVVLDVGRQIAQVAGQLDGSEYNADPRSDVRTPANARLQSTLLHLAHLCDLQRLAVLNEYHQLRGFSSPEIRT